MPGDEQARGTARASFKVSPCSLRLAAAAIRLRLRLLQYFSLYGLQLQQSKQLQQCRLAASRTRPCPFCGCLVSPYVCTNPLATSSTKQ
jgi:hypothetical protein